MKGKRDGKRRGNNKKFGLPFAGITLIRFYGYDLSAGKWPVHPEDVAANVKRR